MKVLIVWQEIPEITRLFILDLDGVELEMVRECHNKLSGRNMSSELESQIISRFYDNEGESGPWTKYEVQSHRPTQFCGEVILTGQVC